MVHPSFLRKLKNENPKTSEKNHHQQIYAFRLGAATYRRSVGYQPITAMV